MGAPPLERVNVAQPKFFAALDEQLRSVPLANWRTYLRYRLVNATASLLRKRFYDAIFDFFGRALQGTKEQLPRWEQCVNRADVVLVKREEAYVERHSRRRPSTCMAMSANLIAALAEEIRALPG